MFRSNRTKDTTVDGSTLNAGTTMTVKKGNFVKYQSVVKFLFLLCSIACVWNLVVTVVLPGIGKHNTLNDSAPLLRKDSTIDCVSVKIKLTWPNWPATAYEELNHPLVFKGNSFVQRTRDLVLAPDPNKPDRTLLDEFIEVYKARPDQVNMCGIRINHALALFLTVRQIKPTLVVESGVNAGVSTYFIRAASADTKIYALDPEDKPICGQKKRWIDPSDKTTYFIGDKFVDVADHNWREMTANGEMIPESTLIFLDDHMHVIERIPALIKAGIRHVMVEDNYKHGEGATVWDKTGSPKQAFNDHEVVPHYNMAKRNTYVAYQEKDAEWLFNNLISYSEFPPIVPPIMSKEYQGERKPAGGFMHAADKNDDIVAPVLRPDLDQNDMKIFKDMATALDLDVTMVDRDSYLQFMNYNQIMYMELLHMPHHLAEQI